MTATISGSPSPRGDASPKNKNVLISGASIAGPALAYWLHRYGFRPTVVERAPALREGGYAVDIRGAAMDVIKRMGLLAEAQRAHTNMGAMVVVDRAGERVATMPDMVLSGDIEILRGDLSRILHEHTRGEVEYVFGDSITSLTESDDGVRVTFERGAPRTFDLVVGADGLHSSVRALAFGEESQFVRDFDCYVSIFTTENFLNLSYAGRLHSVPDRTVGVYSARQNTEAKAIFLFASPPVKVDRRDVAQQKKLLAGAFAGVGWEVPRLLEAARVAPDFYFDTISQVRMDRWSRGRVVLLGDAGYCPSLATGQGTSLALVGAYVLAGELAAAGGDHGPAFARYDAEMRDFVEKTQAFGREAIKDMVPRSRAQLWFQTQMLRTLPYLPWKNLVLQGIERKIRRVSAGITLQDYQC